MKRKISIILTLVLILSTASMSFADNYDLHNINDNSLMKWNDFLRNPVNLRNVADNIEDYVIKYENKFYSAKDLDDATKDGIQFGDAIASLKPVEWTNELNVTAVSAITDQVLPASDAEAELKFLVNGTEELTATEFAAKYGEEGYTVAYKYNFTGELKAQEAGTHKYAVEVTDADGNVIPEGGVVAADFVDFKLVNATEATEVTEFGLDNELNFVAMGDEDVKIEATKALNGLGEELEDGFPEVEKVTSSDIAVAQYTKADGIKTNGVGTVTFTVKFEDIEETYPLTIEVKEAREATSISNENIKEAASETYTLPAIEVLDQYDAVVEALGTLTIVVKDSEGVVVEASEGNKYDLSKEDVYTVAVSLEDEPKTNLGSFTIETVDVDGAKIDEYKLVFADEEETELDINPLLEPAEKELTLAIEGYIKGVEQEAPTLAPESLIVKSSNDDIAELDGLKVTGKKAGTVTITLYTVEGALETPVAEIDVVVKNTTPQITNLTLATGTDELVIDTEKAAGEMITNLENLKSTDVDEVTAEMIESVIFSEVDGVAIVKLKAEFGGKTFTFDAVKVVVEP